MGAVGCGSSPEEKKAVDELNVARVAASRGDFDEAMRHLDVSIAANPSFDAYRVRADLFWQHGEYGRAGGDIRCRVIGDSLTAYRMILS